MKKIIVLTLLLGLVVTPVVAETNWDKFISGRNSIRLEGYQGMPGIIVFEDGNGNEIGYMWYNDNLDRIVFCSDNALDLTTTKLSDLYGVPVDIRD